MIDKCLITLEPLKTAKEKSSGYSTKGIKALIGDKKASMVLPFTRKSFIQDKPSQQDGMSISGYQPKLSIVIRDKDFEVVGNGGNYILKPSPEAFPFLALNEHAIMTVMKRAGFNVPSFGLVSFDKDRDVDDTEYAFIIRRYDRLEDGTKLHQEQLDGAMGVADKFGKVNGESSVSYSRVCSFILDTVGASIALKKDLFLRIAFAYLVGNNDLHLRNFGLLMSRGNKYSLAPVYDFVSTAPYFEGDLLALPLLYREESSSEVAPGINTKHGAYIGYDFILFAGEIGISEKMANKLLDQLTGKLLTEMLSTIENSYIESRQKKTIISCIKTRGNALRELEYNPL